MPTIVPLQPAQAAETRRMIHTVAHAIFPENCTLEERIQHFEESWPIRDVLEFEEHYLKKNGVFLITLDDEGRVIGSGAFKDMGDGACEIKRLWFLPEYHGQGLGYQMIVTLLDLARQRGYTVARLCTSPAYQPRAFAFYQRLGFYEIPRYNEDPDDVSMELYL